MIINQNTLIIYADGSSYSKPRRGGVGVRLIYLEDVENEVINDFEFSGYKGVTNNQMELQACIEGLKESHKLKSLQRINRIIIKSDSSYVVSNINNAKYYWPPQWCNKFGKPIENVNQWKTLLKLIRNLKKRVDFEWVKGHSKDEHNKAVDKMAKGSAQKPYNEPIVYEDVRRKKSHKSVEIGSVEMRGQKIAIRIISSKRLREQNVWKFRYEVVSKGSKYYNNIDFIYYENVLRTHHTYLVTFNKNQNYPKISKLIGEITNN